MRPNVVIIVADALRVDRVGAFGGKKVTPNIDDFAQSGVVFSNAFSTTNATDPAVTSIMTGQYPRSHGIINHGKRVTDKEKAGIQNIKQLPKALSTAGYQTAKFGRPLGRWHRTGFEHYPKSGEWRDPFETKGATVKGRLGDFLERVDPRLRQTVSQIYRSTRGRLEEQLSSKDESPRSDIVNKFENFVGAHQPFFGFVHLMDTHTPYEVPTEDVQSMLDRFEYQNTPLIEIAEEFPEESSMRERLEEGGHIYEFVKQWEDTEYGIGTAVVDAHYDAAVHKTDNRIGELIEIMRDKGLLDDTLVFLLSDHGESLTEHKIYYDHHGLYDVSVQVPMVVRLPNGRKGEIDELVQITDIAPTVASFANLEELHEENVDGVNLRPVIESTDTIDRDTVLAEEAHTQRCRMIRTKRDKLIYPVNEETICRYCGIQHTSSEEYYLVNSDPSEKTNLNTDFPDRVADLREQASNHIEELSTPYKESDDKIVEYDDEEEIHKRLEALGYR